MKIPQEVQDTIFPEEKDSDTETLPLELKQEIADFYIWFSEKTDSEKTLHDYTSYIKGFYSQQHRRTGLAEPVRIDSDERMMNAKQDMMRYIGSRATEYGLRKYLTYIQSNRSINIQESRNAQLLDTMLQGEGKKEQGRSRKDKIGAKVRSRNEIETIITSAPTHTTTLDPDELQLFLRVMYETAARVGDIQRLLWGDVDKESLHGRDLDEQEIAIVAERSKSKESGTVRLTESTWNRLQKHRRQEHVNDGPDEFVFFQDRETRKKNYDRIRRAVRAGGKDAGIPVENDGDFGTHNFRHSRLTHLGKEMLEDESRDLSYANVLERLKSYARHKDRETTEIYIEILKDQYQLDISKYFE